MFFKKVLSRLIYSNSNQIPTYLGRYSFGIRSFASSSSSSSSSNSSRKDRVLSSKTELIRNIGIIAHIDGGKTTLTERMIYYSGIIRAMGEVHDGDTYMDFLDAERERGITISSAAISYPWRDHHFNLIDTPGHVDFTGEVERSIRVLDGAVTILDGVAGVEAQTETVWTQADRYKVPRLVFVNKLDREGASFSDCLESISQRLSPLCSTPTSFIPIQLPIGSAEDFRGVVDLVADNLLLWPASDEPDPLKGRKYVTKPINSINCKEQNLDETEIKLARERLIESIAEVDEELFERLLNEEEGADGEASIRAALRRATLSNVAVPVLCGSAFKNKGVQPVMNAVIDYLPSPIDVGELRVSDESVFRVYSESDENRAQPLLAYAFKVQNDKKRGPLVYVRMYSGELKSASKVYNTSKGVEEKVQRILQVAGDMHTEIPALRAGNIGALVGLKSVQTSDSLVTSSWVNELDDEGQRSNFRLPGLSIPEPVFFCSIEPEASSQSPILSSTLDLLVREDPSLEWRIDDETGQWIIAGMGQLHLNVVLDRIRRDFSLEVRAGPMQISYREQVVNKRPVRENQVIERSLGGKQIRVGLEMSVGMNSEGEGNVFTNQWAGPPPSEAMKATLSPSALERLLSPIHLIPGTKQRHKMIGKLEGNSTVKPVPAVYLTDAMVESGFSRGPLVGAPLVGTKVTLHSMELGPSSTPTAVRFSVSSLLRELLQKSEVNLLEPIMEIEIRAPENKIGSIISDLTSKRRASIKSLESSENKGGMSTAHAFVPLESMIDYSTVIRSISGGSANYSMSFSHYEKKS